MKLWNVRMSGECCSFAIFREHVWAGVPATNVPWLLVALAVQLLALSISGTTLSQELGSKHHVTGSELIGE